MGAFNPELRPKNLKPMTPPPPKSGYDLETISDWREAEKLLEEGKITKFEYEDWVDMVFGFND